MYDAWQNQLEAHNTPMLMGILSRGETLVGGEGKYSLAR